MTERRVVIPTEEVFTRHKQTFDILPAMGINPFLVFYFIVEQVFNTKHVRVELLMNDQHELPQAVLDYLADDLGVDIGGLHGDQYFRFSAAVNDFHRAILSVRDVAIAGFDDAVLKLGERIQWLNGGLVISLRERVSVGSSYPPPI